jgi:hypothetical protein
VSLEAGEARLIEGRAAGVVRWQGPPTHLVDGAGTMRVSSGQNAMHAPGRAKTLAIKQTIHDVPPQYLCSQHAARSEGPPGVRKHVIMVRGTTRPRARRRGWGATR